MNLLSGEIIFKQTEQGHKQRDGGCETWERTKTLQEAEQVFPNAEAGQHFSDIIKFILLELATRSG